MKLSRKQLTQGESHEEKNAHPVRGCGMVGNYGITNTCGWGSAANDHVAAAADRRRHAAVAGFEGTIVDSGIRTGYGSAPGAFDPPLVGMWSK